ncbi:MAG: biotin--[acetyl-CoA-carboxylase] ligase [Clostridium sp.]|nr:biotin--[acetyl-CoA-carboxylase] ligase [Clostridium sp.]
MKTEVLRMLKEADDYVSGQQICEKFRVSRTAVWKVMKQLEEEGYEIEAVRRRGYRLKEGGDILNAEEIESSLHTRWAGRPVVYADVADSTNNVIKRLAEEGASHGTLAVADRQTGGKGRRGRAWSAPGGVGIWMSLLLRPEIDPADASMITLISAMAVADGIREETGLDTMIKWPNDVVAGGKKVVGILTEMSSEIDHVNYVVPGIGINVNTAEFPEDIRQTATSVMLETGKKQNRSRIIGAVLRHYEEYYDIFMKKKDMTDLLETYNRRLANAGRAVRVLDPAGEYSGTAQGINHRGELLVETETGEVRNVLSGEVSVRGIYGYV